MPGPLGRIAARLYGAVITRRNRAFDSGRNVVRLPIPVVSVGNLSVGGTGKTPMVAYLCRIFLEAGARPCIAMRGYAQPGGGGGAAIRGEGSDEADAYQREFGNAVDIIAQADRLAGIRSLLAVTTGPPPPPMSSCLMTASSIGASLATSTSC